MPSSSSSASKPVRDLAQLRVASSDNIPTQASGSSGEPPQDLYHSVQGKTKTAPKR